MGMVCTRPTATAPASRNTTPPVTSSGTSRSMATTRSRRICSPSSTALEYESPVGALTGKVAVVTGSAGGIGGAVVAALAAAGADVVGLDREQADLSRGDEVAGAFADVERVDVLVNTA